MPIWETSKWRGASRVTRSYTTVIERDGQRQQHAYGGSGGLLAHPRTPSSPPAFTPSADRSYTPTVSVPSRRGRPRSDLMLDPAHFDVSGVQEDANTCDPEPDSASESRHSPAPPGHQRASPGASVPVTFSSHYYGVAHGELGVLSRRQVMQGSRWQTEGDRHRNSSPSAGRGSAGHHATGETDSHSGEASKLPEVHDAPHHSSRSPEPSTGDIPSPNPSVPPLNRPKNQLPPNNSQAPHPDSGTDTDRSIARLVQSADRGDWLPRSYFAPRGLVKHDADRPRHVHRSHPTTEMASKPLEVSLTGGEQGRGGRRRRKGSRARTRVATAPAASSTDARGMGMGLSLMGDSLPSSPSGHIRSPGAKLGKGGADFDSNPSPPIMKATAAQHNPLSSGGFPGWKTIPQVAASPTGGSRGSVGGSRGQTPQGPPRMVVSRDGDLIRVFESRQARVSSGDKFLSPWNTDPDEILAGI